MCGLGPDLYPHMKVLEKYSMANDIEEWKCLCKLLTNLLQMGILLLELITLHT